MYKGKLVQLRAYKEEDVPIVLSFVNDPEVKKFLQPGIPYPYTSRDEQKWFENNSATKEVYSFAIETIDEMKYIGGCGLNNLDWKNSVATVGIFIGDKKYWGKGYGTDAMNILINFIFNEMNIHKIKLHVFSFNARAIKSYEKCGFKQEGLLRQEIFREGKYHDECIMGLLREEYYKK